VPQVMRCGLIAGRGSSAPLMAAGPPGQPEGAAVDLCHLRGYRVGAASQESLLEVLRRVARPLGLIP